MQQVHCITTLPSTFCLVQVSAASALYHHPTINFFAWYKQVQQEQYITTLPSTFCLVQESAASSLYHHPTIYFLLGTSKCSKCNVSPPYHPHFAWYKQVQQIHCTTTFPSTFCLEQASAISTLYHHPTIHFFAWYKQVQCITALPSTFCLVQASALYHHLTIHFLLGTSKCSKCNVSPPYHPLFCFLQASAASTLYHHPTIYFLLGTSKCSNYIVSPSYHLLSAWYKQVQQVQCITTLPSTFCLVQASAASTLYHHPTIYFLLGTSECSKYIVSPSYHPLFCLVQASAMYHHLTIHFLLGTSKCSKCIVSPPYHPLFCLVQQVQQVQCITTVPSTFCLVQASAASALYHHLTIHFLLGTSKCNVSPPYHPLFAWYKQVQQVHCITTLPFSFLIGTNKCSKCNVSPPYHPLFAWYKQVQQVQCITTLPSTFACSSKCNKCIVLPPYHPLFAWYKQVQCITTLPSIFLLGTRKCIKYFVSPPYHLLFLGTSKCNKYIASPSYHPPFAWYNHVQEVNYITILQSTFLLGTSKCNVSPPYDPLFAWYKQVQLVHCITTLPSSFLLGTSKCSKCNVSPPYHPLFAWYKQVQQVHCITTLPSTFCLVQASAMYHHLTIHFLLCTSKCSKCNVSPPYHLLFAWYKQVQQVHCITTLPSTFCLVQASAMYHHPTIYFLLGTSKCNKCIVSPPYHTLFCLVQANATRALCQHPTIHFLLGTSKCSK